MEKNETEQILAYFDQLIDVTSKDGINWSKANPTTYVWHIPPQSSAKVVLQRVETLTNRVVPDRLGGMKRAVQNNFIFQAIDPASVERLLCDGRTDPSVDAKLKSLFESIESSLARKGLSFLKSIIPPAS